MLMIGASRHLGAALRSETDEEATAFTTNQALMGKTTCIVGLAASVSI
jgi:hypothetical protein